MKFATYRRQDRQFTVSSPEAEGQPPTVYIFYGDDEFAMTEAVADLRGRFSESAAAELTTERFDGRHLELARLEEVCLSAPFRDR